MVAPSDRPELGEYVPEDVVNNRIVKRLSEISLVTTLAQDERDRLFRLLLLVGKKLIATWRHLDRFKSIQVASIDRTHQRLPTERGQRLEVDAAQDLLIELNEFVVQAQSCLDYLAKVPCAILGKNLWPISTFGEQGQNVIRALEQDFPQDLQAHAERLRTLVLNEHLPWLERASSLRDRVNHLIDENLAFEVFGVRWVERDGTWNVHVLQAEPTVAATEVMADLWNGLIALVEDFTASFLAMRIEPGYALFHGPSLPGENSPWQITTKAEVDQVLARVRELAGNHRGQELW